MSTEVSLLVAHDKLQAETCHSPNQSEEIRAPLKALCFCFHNESALGSMRLTWDRIWRGDISEEIGVLPAGPAGVWDCDRIVRIPSTSALWGCSVSLP